MTLSDALELIVRTLRAAPPFATDPDGLYPTVKFIPYFPAGEGVEQPTVAFSSSGGDGSAAELGSHERLNEARIQMDVLASDILAAHRILEHTWAALRWDQEYQGGIAVPPADPVPGEGYLRENGVQRVYFDPPARVPWDEAGRVARLVSMGDLRFADDD